MSLINIKQQSFRTRVVVMASGLLVLLSLLIAIATAWISNLQLRDILFTQGQEWTQSLAESSVSALLYQDAEIIKDSVATIMASGKVKHFELINKHGDVILQQGRLPSNTSQYLSPISKDVALLEDEDSWLYSAIVKTHSSAAKNQPADELGFIGAALQNERTELLLGQVHLTLSKQPLKDASTQIFTYNLIIALSVSAILIVFLSLMSRRLFTPLESLARLMGKTSRGQWLSANKIKGSKEINDISHAYDNMIETLKQRDDDLVQSNASLEETVARRTEELKESNKQLKAFNHSVSHDMRAPLRHINNFSQILIDDHSDQLDEDGMKYLQRVCNATQHMEQLINDMLKLSRISQQEMNRESIHLEHIASEIIEPLLDTNKERKTKIILESDLITEADPGLAWIVLENLINNAWKYSSKSALTCIEIGRHAKLADTFFVRDKGAGFDMRYINKLFTPFSRLHTPNEFEGTGIGLATIKRIIDRHNGKVWAESKPGEHTTFYFSFSSDSEA